MARLGRASYSSSAGACSIPRTASGSRRGRNTARSRSRFKRAMNSSGISFGQTASHSAWFVQLPNSSRAIAATMFSVRSSRSGWPWEARSSG